MGGPQSGPSLRWAGLPASEGPGAASLLWVGLEVGGAAAEAAGVGGGSGARRGRGALGGRGLRPFSRRAPR